MSENFQLPIIQPAEEQLPTTRHILPAWFREAAATLQGAVLLETAKFDSENFRSFLFANPICELKAWSSDEVQSVFEEADTHLREGRFVAGFVSYECGEVLQGIAQRQPATRKGIPLICFGVFSSPLIFDHNTGLVTGSKIAGAAAIHTTCKQTDTVITAELQVLPAEYEEKLHRIHEYLTAGHTYQVNFTDKIAGTFTGTPLDLYEHVLLEQPVPWAALLRFGGHQILSFAPELFYRVDEKRIKVRPMKGTWPRGRNVTEDEEAALNLQNDEKNRAEHITIVDLLRNDLGRVCELGSVQVNGLMHIERYSTLHQMTSDISGTLKSYLTPSKIFQAIFPSGSITGAPKLRTMEIIHEVEGADRGLYTGSIGYFDPQGGACFNVAIRTLLVEDNRFVLGVGGGITADSTWKGEYDECKLKASFLLKRTPHFHLFETMLAISGTIPRLNGHLQRIQESAEYFGFCFNDNAIREHLASILSAQFDASKTRLKLSLHKDGQWQVETSPLDEVLWSGKLLLWPEPVESSNFFLQHKTSHRGLYRRALAEAQQRGFDEVIFQNEQGFLTEGAISNLFVTSQGIIVTPSLDYGLLAGVERGHILSENPKIRVCAITLSDLRAADQVLVCNALRGKRSVSGVWNAQGDLIWER